MFRIVLINIVPKLPLLPYTKPFLCLPPPLEEIMAPSAPAFNTVDEQVKFYFD